MKTRVCVCGGGSLAHAVAGVMAAGGEADVSVLTRQAARWKRKLHVLYKHELELIGMLASVSNDPAEVIPGAGIVIVAVPACAQPDLLRRIHPYLDRDTWVGAFPGVGGFDWVARDALGGATPLFGTQRVPYVRRTLTYGESVLITGIRPQLFLASLPCARVGSVAQRVGVLLNMRVVPMANYLSVTLTPTNPVFHPARLYALFRDWLPGITYPRPIFFYDDWDDDSTQIFGQCDAELQALCRELPLDLSYVKPIVQHYEVATLADLTGKIRNLSSLRGRHAPMQATKAGYVPDISSCYFTEDIPYGLAVIKGIAELAGVPTPTIDAILVWAQGIMNKDFLVAGRLCGRDTQSLPLPQNYGITSVDELVRRASE